MANDTMQPTTPEWAAWHEAVARHAAARHEATRLWNIWTAGRDSGHESHADKWAWEVARAVQEQTGAELADAYETARQRDELGVSDIRIEQLSGPHTIFPGKWEIMMRDPDYDPDQPESRENLEWVPLAQTPLLFETGAAAQAHVKHLLARGEI